MSSIKRRIILGIAMLFLALISCIGVKSVVSAAEFDDAINIPINGSIMGNTEKGYAEESDYYKFTVPDDGYVVINFKNPLQKNADSYWEMRLYNPDYDEICNTDIKGSVTSTDSTAIGVGAGTYYAKVSSRGMWNASSTDFYTIKVNYTSSDVWEKEFNENFVDATPMRINEMYYGTTRTGYADEMDYYSFSTLQDGYIKMRFTNPLQGNSQEYWRVCIYNSQYSEIYAQTIFGNQTSTDLPSIGIPAGTYYIKVNSRGMWNASSTDIYGIKVNFTMSEFWEKEINDDFTSATPIRTGSQYSGATLHGYNAGGDYYKFNISSKGLYAVGLTTSKQTNDKSYWEIHLYNSTYQELGVKKVYGNKTFHSISQTLLSGTYYVKVNSSYYSEAASMDSYSIKVAPTTKAEMQKNCDHEYTSTYVNATYFKQGYKLHKCEKCGKSYKDNYTGKKRLRQGYVSVYSRGGKKKLYIYWDTISDASGYEIRYSKTKGMKKGVKIKTVNGGKKNKKILKNLSKKQRYFVQVRAYKKSGSKIAYGNWSAKRRIKTK